MSILLHAPNTVPSAQRGLETLRITEIFFSLQGETSRVGLPTVFVRLTGCPLRCGYCDTAYAFHGGTTMVITDVLAEIARHQAHYVTVTGGEPLAQKHCLRLLARLCDVGYSVSLETSGAIDIAGVDPRVSRIVDLKTPGSGEVDKNLWTNIDRLNESDEVKFVLCDEADYRWARDTINRLKLHERCPILFSPVHGVLSVQSLADWVLRDRLPVRFQLQLHKQIWGDERGR